MSQLLPPSPRQGWDLGKEFCLVTGFLLNLFGKKAIIFILYRSDKILKILLLNLFGRMIDEK
jgi:hypothetical protein